MKSFLPFIMIMLFFCSIISSAQNADIDLLKQINQNRNKSLDKTFSIISNSVLPLSLAVPVGACFYALGRKDSASISHAIIITSSIIITSIIITPVLKCSVKRDRPYITYSFIDNVNTEKSYSFPSGHTSAAFSLATSVSIAFPKWYIIVPSFIYATAVGYSRMDLGVHYPSDVVMGALIGSGSTLLSYKINQWWIKGKSHKKVKKPIN
jgi:membrane-associated phospholipid phosphatase